MKKLFVTTCFLLLISWSSNAQLSLQYEELYSTHSNWFSGFSIIQYKNISNLFSAGAGVEYAHAPLHNDNGWVLTNLNFVPLFIDLKYQQQNHELLHPYVHLSQGVSIISYLRKDNTVQISYKVKEAGYFASGEIGVSTKINSCVSANIEMGMKAFHLSGNDMDVNPHGITGSIGLLFIPVKKK